MRRLFLLLLVILMLGVSGIAAQSETVLPADLYFLAPDDDDIWQLWHQPADGSTAQPLTTSEDDVVGYSLSDDAIAYSTLDAIFLRTATDDTEAVVTRTGENYFGSPALSPDATRLAYNDGGLYLLNLQTGESQQIAEDVPFSQEIEDVGDVRRYIPQRFLDPDTLLVRIGLWESSRPALYDLADDELNEEAETFGFSQANTLRLQDGRYVFYAYVAPYAQLEMIITPPDALTPTQPVNLAAALEEELAYGPRITDINETEPGTLRFIGRAFADGPDVDDRKIFTGVYDLETATLDTLREFDLSLRQLTLSPDSDHAAGLADDIEGAVFENIDFAAGQPQIIAVASGEILDLDLPAQVGRLRWFTPAETDDA